MKGIIFTGDSIPNIQALRKTMTRRPIKPCLPDNIVRLHEVDPIGCLSFQTSDQYLGGYQSRQCPYQVGDVLYVKETFYAYGFWGRDPETGKRMFVMSDEMPVFFADTLPSNIEIKTSRFCAEAGYYKRPALFLPEKYARTFIEVTSVKVERVQDISDADARLEGAWSPLRCVGAHRDAFKGIWDGLYGSDPIKGWEANPWCFVYEFRRIEK